MRFTDDILSPSFDATEDRNEAYELGVSEPTSIQVFFEGITATGTAPAITISASNNGINYVSLDSTVFPYTAVIPNDSFMLIQQSTPYRFIRVEYVANNANAGTYSISIVKK